MVIYTLMYGDITAMSVAVNQRVFGPASLIWANAATSDHLLHISGQVVAKYHLQTKIKSPNVYIESSSRISKIHFDEKSIFNVVSFTLASDGSQDSVKKKLEKDVQNECIKALRLYLIPLSTKSHTWSCLQGKLLFLFCSTHKPEGSREVNSRCAHAQKEQPYRNWLVAAAGLEVYQSARAHWTLALYDLLSSLFTLFIAL